MQRYLAASVLLASCIVGTSAFAQRHAAGAHFSSGHGGGFSAPAGRGFAASAPRSFGSAPRFNLSSPAGNFSRVNPPRSFMPAPRFAPPSGYRVPLNRGRSGGRDGYRRDRYRRPYFSVRSTYLAPGLLNYWPYELGYPEFSGYYNTETNASTSSASQQDVQDYAQAQDNTPAESYRPQYQPNTPSAPPASEPELTVIFKDGHSLQIRNFALTGSTLIVLDEAASGRERRIPLDQVDVPATARSARDAGLDFTPPAGS